MVDDAAARRCARTLNIATLGTGGMLVLAKRRGLISFISPALQALQDAELWLSNDLIALLKQVVILFNRVTGSMALQTGSNAVLQPEEAVESENSQADDA